MANAAQPGALRSEFFDQLRRQVAAEPETEDEQAERQQWLAGPFEDPEWAAEVDAEFD